MARLESFEADRVGRSLANVTSDLLAQSSLFTYARSSDAVEVLTHLAEAQRRMGAFEEALASFRMGLRIWIALKAENRACWCLWGIGTTHRVAGNFGTALKWLRRASALAKSSGERRCYLWSEAEITEVWRILGRRAECYRDHLELLGEFKAVGDTKGVCWALTGVGQILRMERHYRDAESRFQRALVVAEGNNDVINAGYAFRGLAEISKDRGAYDIAQELAGLALANFLEKGYPTGEAYARKTLADIAVLKGEVDGALSMAEHALSIFRSIGKRRGIAFALKTYADIRLKAETPVTAQQAYSQSRSLFARIGVRNLSMFDPQMKHRDGR